MKTPLFIFFCIINAFMLFAHGAELPEGFFETQVTTELEDPTSLKFSPDGRLFVLQQTGQIRVLKNGALLSQPFLKLDVDGRGEHGLLGLEFDPEFDSNSYVYVYYTALTPAIHNRVSRFTAQGDQALEGSEKIILELDDVGLSIFHSAGALHFSPDNASADKKLFIGVGDNANRKNAQLKSNPFGKILRINADGSIPQDNPFYNTTTGIGRAIWAYGFRNPFSFHFQRGTDRMYINDVGAESWEDIKEGFIGKNYGWPLAEGYSNNPDLVSPIYSYPHGPTTSETEGCAISGGAFYDSDNLAFPKRFQGQYFFMDYCSGWLRVLNPQDHTVSPFGKGLASNPVSLEVGPDGKFYFLSRWLHGLFAIEYNPKLN